MADTSVIKDAMIVERIDAKPVMVTALHYKKQGRSLSWFVVDTVETALANDYEYAKHPESGKMLQSGVVGDQEVMILMVRPANADENGKPVPAVKSKPESMEFENPSTKAGKGTKKSK